MKRLRLIALAVAVLAITAQSFLTGRAEQAPALTPAATGPFDALHFRSIGPASMSGRISDLAVFEANPAIFYVATAHGGVWKTTNNGTTFEAQFQDQGLMSIGDVTVSQSNPDLVWVGTGESNNRQSTSWGDGVYKSTDGGKTYTNMGLRTSKHINRIVIDPRNTDVVLVAATGSLWGPGGERGVFKTADGGKTWKQVLEVDDDTGANELVMDPTEQPDRLRVHVPAAADGVLHERRRPGQRYLEVDRRRRDVDAHQGRRSRSARSAASRSTSTASGRTFFTRPSKAPSPPPAGADGAMPQRRPRGRARRPKALRQAAPDGRAAVAPRDPTPSRPASIVPTTAARRGGR